MSRTKTIPKLPAEARPLQQQLRAWRAQRRPGMPIPEELWARAVALAGKHGVGSLARGLPLDHGALKKRVERAVSAARSAGPAMPWWRSPGPTALDS